VFRLLGSDTAIPRAAAASPRSLQVRGRLRQGVTIAIARGVTTCPVKAVKAWLQAAGISEGPLFYPVAKGGRLGTQRLTDKSVCDLVKAERTGFKGPTSAPIPCAPASSPVFFKMRDVSRHKLMDVLQAYVRDADLFRDHAGAGLL
jgi:hypothetical protein